MFLLIYRYYSFIIMLLSVIIHSYKCYNILNFRSFKCSIYIMVKFNVRINEVIDEAKYIFKTIRLEKLS